MKKINAPEIGTDKYVKFFENEQKKYGTKVALGNLIWEIGANVMSKSGVISIKTKYRI